MSNTGQYYDPIAHVATLQQTLAAVTKERDDWYQAGLKIAVLTCATGVEGPGIVDAVQQLIARAKTAESVSDVCNDLIKAQGLELSALRAELAEAKKTVERSCRDWAEDDTEIKRLAESVGVQGESKDDNFRSAVDVVADLVAALSEAKRDKGRLDWLSDPKRVYYIAVDRQPDGKTIIAIGDVAQLRAAIDAATEA